MEYMIMTWYHTIYFRPFMIRFIKLTGEMSNVHGQKSICETITIWDRQASH